MGYLDIAASGMTVRGTAIEDGGEPVVQFGGDLPIKTGVYVRDLRLSPDGSFAVFKGQNDTGYIVSRNGSVPPFGAVFGEEAVAISDTGKVGYCTSNRTYVLNGVQHEIPLADGTTQGIHSIDSAGNVVWTDQRLHHAAQFGPLSLVKWTTMGPWTFGVNQWGIVAWNAVEKKAYAVQKDSSPLRTPRGAIVDGVLVIVLSLPERSISQPLFQPWPPPVTYAPVVRIGRPLWMGWFFWTGSEPANCHFLDPSFTGHKFIAGPDWRYVSGASDGDVESIRQAIASAANGRDILVYVPRQAQHALPFPCAVQGIEAYLGANESDDDFLKRIVTSIRVSPRAVLIANCYTSNTNNTSDLRRVPGLIAQLARDHANVEGILVFSGAGRGTGWGDHPEVHDAWRQVFEGIPSAPPVVVTPEPLPEPGPEPTPPTEPTPEPAPTPVDPPRPPTMTQPPFTRPEPYRPDKPVGGNAIADFIRALSKINFRKLFKGWFR